MRKEINEKPITTQATGTEQGTEQAKETEYTDGSKEYKEFLKGAIRLPELKKREDGTTYEEEVRRWMILVNVEEWTPRENYSKVKKLKRTLIEKVEELSKGKIVKRIIFQIEAGEIDRLVHIHFYIELKKARGEGYIKERFKEWFTYDIAPAHVVIPKKEAGVIKYIKKEPTRIMGKYYDSRDDYTTTETEVQKYRDSQEMILKQIEELENNEILFIIDEGGGIGKSTLALKEAELTQMGSIKARRHTIYLHDGFKTATDCFRYLSSMFINAMDLGVGLKYESPTVFVDCVRMSRMSPYDLAGLLERIKNGAFYDDRYGSKFRKVKTPKVCVFSNKKIPGITHKEGEVEATRVKNGVRELVIIKKRIENSLLTESRISVCTFSKKEFKRKEIKGKYIFIKHDEEGKLEITPSNKGHNNMYLGDKAKDTIE